MKISIITVNYNNLDGLTRTIDSVIQQRTGYEFIVIDGGSTDGSFEIIKHNEHFIDYWISEKDTGIYNAMNKGINKATGDYLLFLNSGDCFVDGSVLEKCYASLEKYSGVDVFYGDIIFENSKLETSSVHKHPGVLSLNFLYEQPINHQASLIKADLFREFGPYPECYRLASDYWMFLKAFISDKIYLYLDFIMVLYDATGVSAEDGFKEYRAEQNTIWERLVPIYVKDIMAENKRLLKERNFYKNLTEFTIVKAAIKLNDKFQSIKNSFGYK